MPGCTTSMRATIITATFMLNLAETRNIHGLANREWFPLVLL
jgi:hypothetical protein